MNLIHKNGLRVYINTLFTRNHQVAAIKALQVEFISELITPALYT